MTRHQGGDPFTYKNVLKNASSHGDWIAYCLQGWIKLERGGRHGPKPLDYPLRNSQGWKIHISVRENDIPTAWNVLQPTLRQHNIEMKATGRSLSPRFSDPSDPQAGKLFTLYLGHPDEMEPADYWQELLAKIERDLFKAHLRPGPVVKGDRPIKGSSFMAYRNDLNPQGFYERAACSYNPHNFSGPLFDVDLTDLPYLGGYGTQDTLHRLDRIISGWDFDRRSEFYVRTCADEAEAKAIARVMNAYCIEAKSRGDKIGIADGGRTTREIAMNWFDAQYCVSSLMAGRAIKNILLESGFPDMQSSLLMRSSDATPERLVLRGIGAENLEPVREALMLTSGNVSIEGDEILVSLPEITYESQEALKDRLNNIQPDLGRGLTA